MKKAVCISCTHHYGERTQYVESVLQEAGYDCIYITSDFHHIGKKHHKVDLPHCIQIPTRAYTKNISPRRILSHICFAKDARKLMQQLQPDLIYAEIPPNSLCRELAKYKKKHPNVKLIFDIFDMWPESFPSNKLKKLLQLPFRIWGDFRNKSLSQADTVFTECDLFRDALQPHLKNTKSKTLYLCRPGENAAVAVKPPVQDELHLCYLGSINNIIDIPAIANLIGQAQSLRPVVLHIIGDGESREDFIAAVSATGAQVEFHGAIYDMAKKQEIFDLCSFGLNIMKSSVFIGLTMKSIDYFAGGLPIINSIQGDTWSLVKTRGMGINLNRENSAETAAQMVALNSASNLQMRNNTLSCFHELFSQEHFAHNFLSSI